NGVDVDNVSVTTSAGWAIEGSISTDSGEPLTIPRERIRVVGRLLNPDGSPLPTPGPVPGGGPPPLSPGGGRNPDSGRVRDDWTFVVSGLYGPAQLRVNLPDGWAVKAMFQDGRDVTDTPLESKSGGILS